MEINLSICFCNNCSEFSDIFDVKHFKRTLQADVRVVSSLPSTHLMSRQTIENKIPYDVSPLWIRNRFFRQVRNSLLMEIPSAAFYHDLAVKVRLGLERNFKKLHIVYTYNFLTLY